MGIEEWRAKKREKDLDRINRELNELRVKGLQFERGGSSTHKTEHKSRGGLKLLTLGLVIILVVGFFVYFSRVSTLKEENNELNSQLALKISEMENLSGNVEDLAQTVEEKKRSENDLSNENDDLKDLNDVLEKQKKDLEDDIDQLDEQIKDLEDEVNAQKKLVDAYKLCITDDEGDIDLSLSVCSTYL